MYSQTQIEQIEQKQDNEPRIEQDQIVWRHDEHYYTQDVMMDFVDFMSQHD